MASTLENLIAQLQAVGKNRQQQAVSCTAAVVERAQLPLQRHRVAYLDGARRQQCLGQHDGQYIVHAAETGDGKGKGVKAQLVVFVAELGRGDGRAAELYAIDVVHRCIPRWLISLEPMRRSGGICSFQKVAFLVY